MFAIMAISKIADENDRAFIEDLYIKHRYLMFHIAYKVTNNADDAEDAVGDCCVAMIRKIGLLRTFEPNTLRAYITTTARNCAIMLLKHRKKYVELDETAEIMSDMPALDEKMIRDCTVDAVKRAIKHLSENDQMVLAMKYFQKYSDEEIGEMLGIKPVSVRSRLTRARSRLHELLKKEM